MSNDPEEIRQTTSVMPVCVFSLLCVRLCQWFPVSASLWCLPGQSLSGFCQKLTLAKILNLKPIAFCLPFFLTFPPVTTHPHQPLSDPLCFSTCLPPSRFDLQLKGCLDDYY